MVETVTVGDGCRIAWRADGPSDAPWLMLSHALGATMDMWGPQADALAGAFRLLRYDSRGHGGSDAPAGAASLDRLGRDVLELLDALGVERVSFCGLSMGGMVGQWLGIHAPDRIDRLVLANTTSWMGPPSAWANRIATARDKGMQPLADSVIARWFTPGFRAAHPAVVAPVYAMLLHTDPAGYMGCCAAVRDMDLRRTVALIDRPVLVIGGTEDPSTPLADAQALAAAVKGAKLTALEAAHLSNIEQADGFNAAVRAFLQG